MTETKNRDLQAALDLEALARAEATRDQAHERFENAAFDWIEPEWLDTTRRLPPEGRAADRA
jgi:hypothetical protein